VDTRNRLQQARQEVSVNALADACMACFPGEADAADPSEMQVTADGTLTAHYACPLCGLAWRTTWTVAAAWPSVRIYRSATPLMDEVIRLLADLLDGEELEAA
jgi:hypothetical protein